jgi:hypothetical protein
MRYGYAYKRSWTKLRGSISEPETAVCITDSVSWPGVLRRSLKVDRGTRHAQVTFHKSARPQRVAAWRWPGIKRIGKVRFRKGQPRRFEPTPRAVREDGEIVGYQVRLRLRRSGFSAFSVNARWPDSEGCMRSAREPKMQYARWSFAARVR